jgi:cell wall-associated NlpC family hydrolase
MSLLKIKICFFYLSFSLTFTLFFTSCKSGRNITIDKNSQHNHSGNSKKISEKYALLLDISEDQISNSELYFFIDEWYGVPYKYGGCNKKGIDCSNFTATLYKDIYHKSVSGSSSSIYKQCKVISTKDLKEGDLVFFKIEKNEVSHVGIYLHNNKFVHATTKKGVMINDLNENYYKKYFFKAGRILN